MGRLSEGPDGWIGVDFDRTLAHRIHDSGTIDVGPPVQSMLTRVKRWLEEGRNVKIFTARVGKGPEDGRWGTVAQQRELVEQWCVKYLGQKLPVTCEKDGYMIELWDDSAVAVEENTGRQLSPSKVDGYPGTPESEVWNAVLSKLTVPMQSGGSIR